MNAQFIGNMLSVRLASFRLTEIIAHDHPLGALRHELRLNGLCVEVLLDSFSIMRGQSAPWT